ncbi:MAG: oligopeptide transporter, OPT family [Pseudomonadota bacterium]
MAKKFEPYVKDDSQLKELTFKALFLGVILAIVLGAANAYLGLKAGMTVAATFPAAVIAMAVLRFFKGTILEENIARTTGAVGEALAAGAIFTIPAFIMAGVWTEFSYWQSTAVMLVGGLLGVLFVILLRRTLVEDPDLPFPESVACTEIVKAGQKGSTGAGYVFGALGLAAFVELLKNPNGIPIIVDSVKGFLPSTPMGSVVKFLSSKGKIIAARPFEGRFFVESPLASPAILGVGYIIGPRLAAIAFSGGCFGWILLMPLMLFLYGHDLGDIIAQWNSVHPGEDAINWTFMAKSAYNATIKPIAVGAMLVGAFYTLYNMRKNLIGGISRSFKDVKAAKEGDAGQSRTEKDLSFGGVLLAIAGIVIPMIFLYNFFCKSLGHAVIAAIVMAVAGFLFAAVAGYLVGLIGSSSNPISGLTLSTLLIAALLIGPIMGLTGNAGVAAVLGVAAVVCCVAGVAGDMIQDWKVGHLLGGTPWKMQIGGMVGVVAAAFALTIPLIWLHQAIGIGSDNLAAPQAGLMAMMSKGIVGGEMAWPLVIIGMVFAVALILIKSPSPMLIAVGMYLPFNTTFAIFIGGLFKWSLDKVMKNIKSDRAREHALEGTGTLLASGLVAGEALTSIILAALYVAKVPITRFVKLSAEQLGPVSLILMASVFVVVGYVLIYLPFKSAVRFSGEEEKSGKDTDKEEKKKEKKEEE